MKKLPPLSDDVLGKRLDEALTTLGEFSSRSKAQKAIKDGRVFVNGKAEKCHYLLEAGDIIEIEEKEENSLELTKNDIPLDIVYEDEDILILNKPAGLVVHPGNGNVDGTLVNALLFHEKQLANAGESFRPGIVHRIDKDTSGLLAIAKTEQAFASLSSQLATHSMHREYKALVKGILYEAEGKIDAPIGRDPFAPTKNKVDVKKGKEAVTFFKVLQRYQEADVTYVECRLLTGRTHQIRVHMEYIGHPIIGDLTYGKNNKTLYKEGQLLHAFRLTLTHPRTGKEMSFEAPLPPHFVKVLESLNP